MNVDDFTKLILALAVAFAIVLLAWGLFKILNNLANSIQDFRKAIKNTSTLSDYVLEDYLKAREEIYSVLSGIKDFKSNFVDPIRNVGKMASVVAPYFKREKRSVEESE